MAKTEQKKDSESLVINMESMMVPFAILVAGLMIALAVIFTNKADSTTPKDTDTTTGTDTGTDSGDTEGTNDGTATVTLDDDPYLGDKEKATVAIVEFTDYECPYCERHYSETHAKLVSEYVDTGDAILVVRDFPLSFHDPAASDEALAAQCAFSLGGNEAYFEYHDLLFENTAMNGEGVGGYSALEKFAGDVGVDKAKFKECYDSDQFAEEISNDLADGSAAGINGTPGFIIGKFDKDGNVTDGILLAGAYPFESFKAAIDGLLK